MAIENFENQLEPSGCIKDLQYKCESLSFACMTFSNLPNSPSTEGPINPVAARAGAGESRCFRSGDLFGALREVLIEHEGGYYRLRLTQANKLILTK